MKHVFPAIAAILVLAAAPASAQTTSTPGSMGGNQVGTGAIEPPANAGGPGTGSASSSAAITSTPPGGAATTNPTTAGTSAVSGGSPGSGSGRSGGGGRGGTQALCLSAKGSVTSVNPDEFGLDCPQ